jgi:hypothetical protein
MARHKWKTLSQRTMKGCARNIVQGRPPPDLDLKHPYNFSPLYQISTSHIHLNLVPDEKLCCMLHVAFPPPPPRALEPPLNVSFPRPLEAAKILVKASYTRHSAHFNAQIKRLSSSHIITDSSPIVSLPAFFLHDLMPHFVYLFFGDCTSKSPGLNPFLFPSTLCYSLQFPPSNASGFLCTGDPQHSQLFFPLGLTSYFGWATCGILSTDPTIQV